MRRATRSRPPAARAPAILADLPGGPGFVDELQRAWDAGDAVFPVDQRLPASAKRELCTAMRSTVDLADEARFIGMEVLCLGRRASGERFAEGAVRLDTRVRRAGRPVWLERCLLEGGSALLDASAGLAGFSVSGTFLAVAPGIEPGLLAASRDIPVHEAGARHGITALPDILVARYLGHSSEAARQWFVALWQTLRPALIGREAQLPRIWNT